MWNKSSDNTQTPKFLFGLKKKKESKLVPVMFVLHWATKIKPRVVVASDFTFFWSVEVTGEASVLTLEETGVSKAPTLDKNPPLPLLSLDAALLESSGNFSLRNLLLMDLPAITASEFTYPQGLSTKMVPRSWNSFHVGGSSSQCLQTWVISCFVLWAFFIFPVCLGVLCSNTLGHLACFGFSLNTFSCTLFSISSSRYLLYFKQSQIYDLEEVPYLRNLFIWNFWKEYPASPTAGAKV